MIKKHLYYFIKKNSEKSHRKYYSGYYAKEIKEFENCNCKKDKSLIKAEMKALKKFWKVYPFHYYRYRFYRKDCPLTLEQMKNYIPDFFAYYIMYPRSFKERNSLCEDKNLFSAICRGYNINQPELLYSVSKGVITDTSGNTKTITGLISSLKENSTAKLFFKPTYGVGGKGIIIFEKKDGDFYNMEDNSKLSEKFIESIFPFDYIIQAGLIPAEIMKGIYPDSVNTFRIITRCRDNKPEILFTILRIGQNGSPVDNASSGGMYIKIDKETGELDEYAVSFSGEKHTSHPNTGFVFSNYKLPFWEEIIKFAGHLALCFKEIEYVGWDIAYTNNGPAVIEANNGPDISLLQDCYGGVRKELGIDSPSKMWYSNNYALKDL